MVAEINNSPAAVADGRTPDEIAAEFVHRFRLDTPDLTEGAISMDVEEVQVDVSGDRQRATFVPVAPVLHARFSRDALRSVSGRQGPAQVSAEYLCHCGH